MSGLPSLPGPAVPARMVSVYIDETGDRGFSEASCRQSPFFAMSALMVPAEDDWSVIATAAGLRAVIHQRQPNRSVPLHWVDHFKKKRPERRAIAAQMLSVMPSAKVIHVIAPKCSLGSFTGLSDGVRFYNFTTRLLLERVALAADKWEGGPRLANVRLGAVKGMDHKGTVSYLNFVRQGVVDTFNVPWQRLKWPPVWVATDWDGIQLADIHAGLLNAALSGEPDDETCAENLLLCKHQLHRSRGGVLMGYGVKVIGTDHAFVTGRTWWNKWNVA